VTLALHVCWGPAAVLEPPVDLGSRAWILGVVAVQVTIEDGRLGARLRMHRTGDPAARVEPLGSAAIVHVGLGGSPAPVTLVPPAPGGARARLTLAVDGVPQGQATLAAADLARATAARAFAHVFCRWLRQGPPELGADLTDFTEVSAGQMYPRKLSLRLDAGQTVSVFLRQD
jgi:hypothetical protein